MRLSWNAWEYPLLNIFLGSDKTFRIILALAVSGSTSKLSLLATMEAKQPSSGKAILIWTLRTYRHAREKLRYAAPRPRPGSIHRKIPGRCWEVSYGQRAKAGSV